MKKYLVALLVTLTAIGSSFVAQAGDGAPIVIAGKSFKIQGGAKKLQDEGVTVVSVSPTNKGWHIQLPLAGKVAPGTYDLRAQVKVTGGKEGYGVRFAIYSPKEKKCPFKKVIKATSVPAGKFEWVKLGQVTVNDDAKAYFFISSAGDSSFEQFLVKALEFTPVKK